MSNKPLNKFRDKGICLTIWPSNNGGYQINVEKSYKTKDSNEWKKTDKYFPDELERLEKLCAQARAWIHEQSKPADEVAPSFEDDDIPFL